MDFKIKLIDKNPIPKENRCQKCNKNEQTEDHTCPYSEDIHGDSESLCNCCSDCEHECAMDI